MVATHQVSANKGANNSLNSRTELAALPSWCSLITAQSIRLSNQTLEALMVGLTLTTMTSTPLWMTTREVGHIEPGAWVYKGGNVIIFFLSHVFFLITVVWHPYFHFASLHEETNHYLLAFLSYTSSLIIPSVWKSGLVRFFCYFRKDWT